MDAWKFIVNAGSDTGQKRETNEDFYLIDKDINLFIVADGMGGLAGGEVASSMATKEIQKYIRSADKERFQSEDTLRNLLTESFESANVNIRQKIEDDPLLKRIGTTIVLSFIKGDRIYIAHSGDSRAYLINTEGIEPLTRDHTLVALMLSEGKITPEEAAIHPMRSKILRAIGPFEKVKCDITSRVIQLDDIYLLCTDGLWGEISDETIKDIIINNGNSEKTIEMLIRAANKAGGGDNITVLIISPTK
jgi:protein phosphatase